MSPEKFLHTKDGNLQRSQAVSETVEKQDRLNLARRNDILESTDSETLPDYQEELESLRRTPNTPEARINAYLKRLEAVFLDQNVISEGSDEETTKAKRNLELLKPHIYKEFTIKEEDIPESFWNLQRKVAREEGRDFPEEISDTVKKSVFEKISEDQKHSLDYWVAYLTGPNALYPMWFKFFAIKSVIGLAEYDKKEHAFPKRTKSTTGLYPDLNAEALSYVCEFLEKQIKKERVENPIPEPANLHAQEEKPVSDVEFQRIISSENFAKYYGFALEHMTAQKELWPETRGEWRVFDKGEDAELVKSLQGKGTGWCTAGAGMAETQLSMGQFHVYYSLDKLGQPTIPRIAIRLEGARVAEVRGVEADQNLDPFIAPVLEDKLPEFGKQAERYLKQTSDMKRLTELDTKTKSQEELTIEDLRFLRELDDNISSFRQRGKDPRIHEILSQREWFDDMQKIYATSSHEELAQKLIADKNSSLLLGRLEEFSGLSTKTAMFYIETGSGYLILRNWKSFENLEQGKVVDALIKNNHDKEVANNLDRFTDLSQQEIADKMFNFGSGITVAQNFDTFTEIDQMTTYSRLLKEGKFEGIARNANKFTEVNPAKIAVDLAEAGSLELVLEHYQRFSNLDDQYFAEYAIGTGNVEYLARNLDKFKSIEGESVAYKLLEQGFGDSVARNINVFTSIDKQKVVDRLFELGEITAILDNIKKFSDVSLDLEKMSVVFLENLSERNSSLRNIGLFPKEFQLQCAKTLIENGNEIKVAREIKNIDGELHKEISLQISDHALGFNFGSIFDRSNAFSEIHSSVAFKLLREHKALAVIETLEKYPDLDHQEFVNNLNLEEIAGDVHKFKNLDQETFERLLTTPPKGTGERKVNFDYLLRCLENFKITDYQVIADKLIELNQQDKLAGNLDKFQNLASETAEALLPINSYLVAKYIDRFAGVKRREFADKLVSMGKFASLAENLTNFPEISQESLEKIITKQTHSEIVQGLSYLDTSRFDQDALAIKLLEAEENVYFCGLRRLDRYKFLTTEQLDGLKKLPQDMRAEAARRMANETTGV